jgi:hypothetical protein
MTCRNLRLLLILIDSVRIGGLKVKAGTGVCSMPLAGGFKQKEPGLTTPGAIRRLIEIGLRVKK